MARGRFLSNKIATDRKVHELSNDTCRLAYTWSISFADKEGRVIGEPEMLLALIFPRRRDITIEIMQSFIDEWVKANFIFIYQNSDGDRVIQFINFEKNQVGLRKDKEPESLFDNPEDCRIIAGRLPEKDRVNINRIEFKENRIEYTAADVYKVYQDNIGQLSGVISEKIDDDIKEYSANWVVDAIKRATVLEKRSLGYVEGILKGWKRNGKNDKKPKGKSIDDLKFENV